MKKGKRFFIMAWALAVGLLFSACQGGGESGRTQESGEAQENDEAQGDNAADESSEAEEADRVRKSGRTQGSGGEEEDSKMRGSRKKQDGGEETGNEDGFPGEYAVPDGWVKAEKYSTAGQIFYVEEGHEEDAQPDNISISIGTNRYSAEEHEDFKNAILQQIMMQIGKQPGVNLYGDGSHTEQGYVVYTFTIEEEQEGIVTKQYYIVDDYRFCLIHLTNFTGSESADEAARAMVDSFVWEE